jgi:hypothetical protein
MDDSNVTTLRPRTGGSPPGLPPLPSGGPPDPPAAAAPPAPPPDEGSGAAAVADRRRRSAADSLAALGSEPPPLPPVRPGHVPATFRSEPPDDPDGGGRPGLGALSLSAILAVALAALRGTAGAVRDWRQRRMERAAEAEPLRKARMKLAEARLGTDAALAGKPGKVPTSHDWGRKSHKGGGGSGRSGGSGKGPSGRASSGGSSKPTGSRSDSPKKSSGKGTSPKPGATGTGSSGAGKHGGRKPGKGKDGSSVGGAGKPGKGLGLKGFKGRKDAGGKPGKRGGKNGTNLPGKLGKSGKGGGKASELGKGGKAWKDRKDGSPAAKPGKAGTGKPGKGSEKADDGRVTLGKALGDEAGRRIRDRFNSRWNDPDPPFLRRHRKNADDASDSDDGPKGAEEAAAAGPGTDSTGDPDAGAWKEHARYATWTPPPRGERRSADESMRDATDEGVTFTAERANRPGDNERPRWEPKALAAVTAGVRGLPRAPHRPRPGTTRTTTTKEARVSAPIRMPGPGGAAAEHMTEVTLDDVLDHLKSSKQRCFATYDECARLAQKATALRYQFLDLAEELRARHNLIGRLTGAAMARLAESMDLIARKCNEMRGQSLTAAESTETAHDAMHDAHRPVQMAAADAGLHMPSARIHNKD